MNRQQFIKYLFGSVMCTGLPQVAKALVQHPARKVYLLQHFVRGFKHYAGQQVLHNLQVGTALLLKREPNNAYDHQAIAIYDGHNKLGFVPTEHNDMLAKIMDTHLLHLQAEVTEVNNELSSWQQLGIAIYVMSSNHTPIAPHAKNLLRAVRLSNKY
jgi:hypothetical protein